MIIIFLQVMVVVVVVSGLWSIWFVAFIVHLFFCSLARFHTQNFIKRPPEMFKQRGDTCHCFVKLVSFKWVLSTRKSNVWSDIPDLFSWKALQASLTDSTWYWTSLLVRAYVLWDFKLTYELFITLLTTDNNSSWIELLLNYLMLCWV